MIYNYYAISNLSVDSFFHNTFWKNPNFLAKPINQLNSNANSIRALRYSQSELTGLIWMPNSTKHFFKMNNKDVLSPVY